MLPIWAVLGVLLLAVPLSAQPEMLWSQRFGDQGFDLHWHQAFVQDADTEDLIFIREHPSEDGLTRNYLTRVTPSGDLVWRHLIPGGGVAFNIPALIKTTQGFYAMVGGSPIIGVDCEFLFVIMDENGELVHFTVFENGPASHGNSLVETADGGFALSGYFGTQIDIRLDWDFWLIRTDSQGQLLWSRTYGTPEEDQVCQAILQTTEGGFLMAGTGGNDIQLKRVDANGDLLWEESYGGAGSDECNALIPDREGGYILAGSRESDNREADGFVVSINGEGNTRWSQTFGGRLPDKFGGAVITSDNGVALFGTTQSALDQNGDYWLLKVGPLGNVSWECTFGGEDPEEGNAIVLMSDGGFALIGNSSSFGAQFGDVWMVMTTPDPDVAASFTIQLTEGWSFISSPINPVNPDMEAIWDTGGRVNNVVMVKDQFGRFFIPARGFDGIQKWDVRQGYLVYMQAPDSLTIVNQPLDPLTPIPVRDGWNLVSYFPTERISAPDAFVLMGENLEMVKNDQGQFYDHSANFSNMGLLRRGEGYNVKATIAGELIWNIPDIGDGVEPAQGVQVDPVHFKAPKTSWRNMSLLISDCGIWNVEFKEIGVFARDGRCVGAASFPNVHSDNRNSIGIAVWGDDPETPGIEGAKDGETLSFVAWDGVNEQPVELDWTSGDDVYRTDELHRAALVNSPASPVDFLLETPHPNPFNGTLPLHYSLPQAGVATIVVLDLSGRRVTTLVNSFQSAGEHRTEWNASAQPSGIYVIKMQTDGGVQTAKAVLVK